MPKPKSKKTNIILSSLSAWIVLFSCAPGGGGNNNQGGGGGGGGGGGTGGNNPPTINSFSVNPNSGNVPLNVTFNWDINDVDGDQMTCKIDVNNDGADEYTITNCTSSNNQAHTYSSGGNYTAKLTVIDSSGDTATSTVTITVNAGGGGGGGGSAPVTYLPFKGSINLVDPANPTSPLSVSTMETYDSGVIFFFDYDPSTKIATNFHPHFLFYIEDDGDGNKNNGGNLMKLLLDKGTSAPTPTQIDTGTCWIMNKDSTSTFYYLVYRKAVNNCDGQSDFTGDDDNFFISSNVTTPRNIGKKQIIFTLFNNINDTDPSGFIVLDRESVPDPSLVSCSPDMSTCSTTLATGTGWTRAKLIALDPDGNRYVCVDDSDINTQTGSIYKVNLNGTSATLITGVCDPYWKYTSDNDAVYMQYYDGVNDQTIIQKLSFASGTITTTATDWLTIPNGNYELVGNTTNWLIFKKGTRAVIAVKKSDKTLKELSSADTDPSVLLVWPPGVVRDTVTWNELSAGTPETHDACKWTDNDPSKTCTVSSTWSGYFYRSTINVGQLEPYRYLRTDGVSTDGSTLQLPQGGTLKAIDFTTSTETVLGTVPNDKRLFGVGFGDFVLFNGIGGGESDIFFAEPLLENSLQRVTNTPNNEFIIY